MLRRIPLASLALVLGLGLSALGIIAYATDNPTLNLAGFFYGIPLVLAGLALKTAELKPVPYAKGTPEEIVALRKKKATPTLQKLLRDVTSYRYGQEAHLDEALKKLGLSPSPAKGPVLTKIEEAEVDGNYALILYFDSPFIPLDQWLAKREKITKFFGPGITVSITQGTTEGEIKVSLITT
ncbi:MAG: DUF2854 domain-containing protein [Geminocystis sp.]|nr:DUF2854 domain-containing protein [Geminocystis sp.]HIK38127.1 DUF2854 domain-containing protein [Geminocystis sp. M7585_C2015_104]MCS7147404.1 DUF2854 domain-containing protein [Geminocystis sp.]MCX8079360.1 DUF2854 domain-containing protein [Geminocystis sp.]MDW8117093.1 DUF2854 domain-containing protein [Geminocystis sp.]